MPRVRWMMESAAITLGLNSFACGALTAPDAELATRFPNIEAAAPSDACRDGARALDRSLLIDDMEDGDNWLHQVADRNGSWWVSSDFTPTGLSSPSRDGTVVPQPIPGGRCGSLYAVHFTGSGFDDWGANISFAFRYEITGLAPVDLSEYRGISFWARIGGEHDASVSVELQDEHSIPEGGLCDERGDAATLCWNGFGTGIGPLQEDWQRYDLFFERLAQGGYGLRAGGFDAERVYSMEFGVGPASDFDLWIDDIVLLD